MLEVEVAHLSLSQPALALEGAGDISGISVARLGDAAVSLEGCGE